MNIIRSHVSGTIILFHATSVSFNSKFFRPSPASRHPTHVRATYTPIVLQCGVAHASSTRLAGQHGRQSVGCWWLPVRSGSPPTRGSGRSPQKLPHLASHSQVLAGHPIREATRNLQMYLMNSGQLPALDMDFEDEWSVHSSDRDALVLLQKFLSGTPEPTHGHGATSSPTPIEQKRVLSDQSVKSPWSDDARTWHAVIHSEHQCLCMHVVQGQAQGFFRNKCCLKTLLYGTGQGSLWFTGVKQSTRMIPGINRYVFYIYIYTQIMCICMWWMTCNWNKKLQKIVFTKFFEWISKYIKSIGGDILIIFHFLSIYC